MSSCHCTDPVGPPSLTTEEENHHLKKQVQLMQEEAAQLEQQHCQQMAEAVENLRVAQETHKSEISHLQDRSNQQREHPVCML